MTVASAFIFDTSVLSPLLDPLHSRHSEVRAVIGALDSILRNLYPPCHWRNSISVFS